MSLLPEIPESFNLEEELDKSISPDKTYRIDFENKRILGKVEEEDAVMQFVRKALNTDKYAHEIYDWYYGNELSKLHNQPFDYVCAEIPRIVNEALKTDDRIVETKDYVFERTGLDSMNVTFTVVSVYSEQTVTTEVPL